MTGKPSIKDRWVTYVPDVAAPSDQVNVRSRTVHNQRVLAESLVSCDRGWEGLDPASTHRTVITSWCR